MKIKRLKVPDYKNIAIDLELRTDLITLLVGQNGMGKSNLLEILLLIFDELNQLAAGRRPKEGEMILTNYVLEYECRGHSYKAVKDRGLLTLWEPDSQFEEGFEAMLHKIPFEALPSQIIGYYSGENKRVRTLVAKHIKREESSKRRRYSKGEIDLFEPKRLFFAENRHSMLVLTTLLLYREHPVYGQQIKKVLQDVVQIGEWGRIEVRFRNPSFAKMGQLQKQHHTLKDYYEMLLQGEVPEGANVFWGIRGNVDRLLSLLLNDAIVHERKFSIKKAEQGSREFFELETIPADNEFRTQLFVEFPAPMDFLNTLEECYVLNMVDKLDVVLQKTGEKAFYPYLQLSEGEQQYLTVMGLIALAHSRDDETLFLLDEPDTHINPQWQRSYIKHILDLSNTEADKKSKVFFISTHSPLLVQANSPGSPIVDLLLFKKNEQGKVIIDTDEDVVKNWRIDQVLMSKYFDLPTSRPASLDDFNVVYQMCHLYHHFFCEGIGLRHFIDYYYLLKKLVNVDDIKIKAMQQFQSFGMERFAKGVMWIEKEVLGLGSEYLLMAGDEKTGELILKEVLEYGNFNKSDMEGKSITTSKLSNTFRPFKFLLQFPKESINRILFLGRLQLWKLSSPNG